MALSMHIYKKSYIKVYGRKRKTIVIQNRMSSYEFTYSERLRCGISGRSNLTIREKNFSSTMSSYIQQSLFTYIYAQHEANNKIATTKDFGEIKDFFAYGNSDIYIQNNIENSQVLCVCESDTIVGYLTFEYIRGNTPFLSLIQITPEYQRRGLGTALLHRFEEIIQEKGYTSYISSTTRDNKPSVEFHKKHGFISIGELNMNHSKEIFFKKELLRYL